MITSEGTLVILDAVSRATPELTIPATSFLHGPPASFAEPDGLAARHVIANTVNLAINGWCTANITNTSLADLAAYFVATSAIGLGVLVLTGHFSQDGAEAFLWWLPGVVVANLVGTSVALRLPLQTFRTLVLVIAFIAGLATAATSL